MATATRSSALSLTIGSNLFLFSYSCLETNELIDVFEEAEQECPNNEELLCAKCIQRYPLAFLGAFMRVSRIIAPTKPSLR